MAISIEVDESKLNGFTKKAIDQIQVVLGKHAKLLMNEIYHLEQGRRHSRSADPEITVEIVTDASMLVTRGISNKSTGLSVKIIRIFAAFFSVIAGMMYNKEELQQQHYLLIFLIVMVVTITFIVLSVLKE